MDAARTCIFCGRTDRPMTREHVFARWLIQKVHGARLVASVALPGAEALRPARVFANVCADCNAGWMSGLEVSFRRLVFARPRTGPIPAVDRVALSRWFAKTAVLLAEAHGAVLLDAAERARLTAGMPERVVISIARVRRPRQRVDFAVVPEAGATAVSVLVDDLVAHVSAGSGRGAGTRLWPLRTHTLRWETLPVVAGLR